MEGKDGSYRGRKAADTGSDQIAGDELGWGSSGTGGF